MGNTECFSKGKSLSGSQKTIGSSEKIRTSDGATSASSKKTIESDSSNNNKIKESRNKG